MIECPIYLIDPEFSPEPSPPPEDEVTCSGGACNCGYLQFENLLNYLGEIKDNLQEDKEKYIDFEFKLREEIIEISRLFDKDAGVSPGYFSKAHVTTTKVFPSNGSRYLKLPDFVQGTLQVRTADDYLLDSSSYAYDGAYLVYLPCVQHRACGCSWGCSETKSDRPITWPHTCYKITARWGSECADKAVQRAIREYLIEGYRLQDPVVKLANGLTVQRNFKKPDSWTILISSFKSKQRFYSQIGIA